LNIILYPAIGYVARADVTDGDEVRVSDVLAGQTMLGRRSSTGWNTNGFGVGLGMTAKRITSAILRRFLRRTFCLWQALGLHVTRNHFYSPIPDTRQLSEDLWTRQTELVGIDLREKNQLELLSLFTSKYKAEYDAFPRWRPSTPYQYYIHNGLFEAVDGEILYCMVRHFRPTAIIEIGSGNSTFLSAQAIRDAARQDPDYVCDFTAIEPYRSSVLGLGFLGLSRLITRPVQEVPLSYFGRLRENDILFIDSSHVIRTGGDVQYEYLEILPRLCPGVIVHVHDIFWPLEYPRAWVCREHLFLNEQYLLQAFLAFNPAFEVMWAGHLMHVRHPHALEEAFSSYRKEGTQPGSFWMRKVR
jgi:hypothetical protein